MAPAAADALRALDGLVTVADTRPGYPCRQCLRDAEVGDELILASHDPFTIDSPYRSASPIFLHRRDCGTPASGVLPEQLTRRVLAVRAFDRSAMMLDAAVVDGGELDACLVRFLADPATGAVHVHNAAQGCWAVTVERNPAPLPPVS